MAVNSDMFIPFDRETINLSNKICILKFQILSNTILEFQILPNNSLNIHKGKFRSVAWVKVFSVRYLEDSVEKWPEGGSSETQVLPYLAIHCQNLTMQNSCPNSVLRSLFLLLWTLTSCWVHFLTAPLLKSYRRLHLYLIFDSLVSWPNFTAKEVGKFSFVSKQDISFEKPASVLVL